MPSEPTAPLPLNETVNKKYGDRRKRSRSNHTCRLSIPALLLLTAVRHSTFKSEGEDYADDFAAVANQQLLLNIARVANDEPAYFIQLDLSAPDIRMPPP